MLIVLAALRRYNVHGQDASIQYPHFLHSENRFEFDPDTPLSSMLEKSPMTDNTRVQIQRHPNRWKFTHQVSDCLPGQVDEHTASRLETLLDPEKKLVDGQKAVLLQVADEMMLVAAMLFVRA